MKVLYVASEALPFMASGGCTEKKTHRLPCCYAPL